MSEDTERRWTLEDVEVAAQACPGTFFIPSEAKRTSINHGRMVRLHFVLREPAEDEPRAERMWVEVAGRLGDGYRGFLTNQPAFIRGLALGDEVLFEARHIAQLHVGCDDPAWNPNGEKQVFAYREDPDREEDSGWRVLAGTETEEEMADPSSIRLCNVGWVCDWDPSLEPLLRGTTNAAFERQGHDESWQLVEDWEPSE